jgi:hypothetical protein
MNVVEDLFLLDPQGDQLVEVEKSAIVELLGADLPEAEAEILLFEQSVQGIEAFRCNS